jgi:hypothetical protein
MFTGILRSLYGPPLPKRTPFTDSILGELKPEDMWWAASVWRGSDSFQFGIGGDGAPDVALLKHAHDIFNNYDLFKKAVRDFIESESRDYPDDIKAEVAELEIDFIALYWPNRPDDGMIFFRNPSKTFRVWRCDYVGRKPTGLGCDT